MSTGNKSGKNAPEQPENSTPSPAPIGLDRVPTNEEYNNDLREWLEKEHGSQLIKYEDLIDIAPDFAIWLKEIIRYGNVDSQVLIYRKIELNPNSLDVEKQDFRCVFYTNDHKYTIYGYAPTEKNPKGYLGCGATTRKPRVGEDWNRGNDLPDGKYCKKTFDSIVCRIVAYELKNLQLWR